MVFRNHLHCTYCIRFLIKYFQLKYWYFLRSGCVDFMISYIVDTGSSVRDFKIFTSVHNIQQESEELQIVWLDGDKLDVTVRAVDIFNKTLDENVTVFRDATPPIIENLWLTRGERLNITVHSLEDFAQMT